MHKYESLELDLSDRNLGNLDNDNSIVFLLFRFWRKKSKVQHKINQNRKVLLSKILSSWMLISKESIKSSLKHRSVLNEKNLKLKIKAFECLFDSIFDVILLKYYQI